MNLSICAFTYPASQGTLKVTRDLTELWRDFTKATPDLTICPRSGRSAPHLPFFNVHRWAQNLHLWTTWVTDTGVCAPVVAAVAVLRADVGVARVRQIAAILHVDFQALGHVHVDHIGGRLPHPDTLMERNPVGESTREKNKIFCRS